MRRGCWASGARLRGSLRRSWLRFENREQGGGNRLRLGLRRCVFMQVSSTVGGSLKAEPGKQHPVFPVGHMLPFVLVTVLFFLWGMSNNLTDILVQQFRKSFELSQFSAQLVQTANFFGYFCMAIPAGLRVGRGGGDRRARCGPGCCWPGVGVVC